MCVRVRFVCVYVCARVRVCVCVYMGVREDAFLGVVCSKWTRHSNLGSINDLLLSAALAVFGFFLSDLLAKSRVHVCARSTHMHTHANAHARSCTHTRIRVHMHLSMRTRPPTRL